MRPHAERVDRAHYAGREEGFNRGHLYRWAVAVIVCVIGAGLLLAGRTSAATRPAPLPSSALPMMAQCGAPRYVPTTVESRGCASLCASYMTGVWWTTWGRREAVGTGTLTTKTSIARPGQRPVAFLATGRGVVACATSTPIHHPHTKVVLSDPEYVIVCPEGMPRTRILAFTRVWEGGGKPGPYDTGYCTKT